MAPSRFAPEPVETTHRSSKDAKQEPNGNGAILARQVSPEQNRKEAPRRFAVEPVETSVKSSKDGRDGQQEEKPKPRKFAVEPVATEHKSSKNKKEDAADKPTPRRFAVEPVETEHKSSKDRHDSDEKPKRRFAPQVVEQSEKSSKSSKTEQEKPMHIKFSPQPVETIYRTNRRPNEETAQQNGTAKSRRFAPMLLDTAKRSRRSGDSEPALGQADMKTESGHHLHAREHRRHIRGDKTPADGEVADAVPAHLRGIDIPAELRRQLSPMDGSAPPRRPSVTSQRSHSFRCPELDTIESSESERNSDMSSLSSSPGTGGSPITASDSSYVGGHKHATRIRESVDENFAQYLLELEAKKAQQRLREMANDAFPNSEFHEPVHHYMNRDDDSDEMEIEDRPVTYDMEEELLLEMAARRESTAKVNWEQLELQRHAEEREQERAAAKTTKRQTQKEQSQSPWWNPAATYGLEFEARDKELKSMQDRARPPMLGNDIVFPRSSSPEPARFDVTQGSTTLRTQMCYLSEHAESSRQDEEDEGLWHPHSDKTRDGTIKSGLLSPSKSRKGSQENGKPAGLWGGFCLDDGENLSPAGNAGLAPPSAPTGLMTPAPETATTFNPFEQSFGTKGLAVPNGLELQTPPTPARQVQIQKDDMNRIDGILSAEQDLDATMQKEYPDSFITQVYNYLSLGYPALARPFDEELSKISKVPIAELRSDDKKAKKQAKGYIRLGEDFEGGGGEGVKEDEFVCMRWRALKLYIREWARQEKDMVKTDGPGGNWGTGARRGSWAI